jgi:hypothetical protein
MTFVDKWATKGMLSATESGRKYDVASAMEMQERINSTLDETPANIRFKQRSVALACRIMNGLPDKLTSRPRGAAKVLKMLFGPAWEVNLEERFSRAMNDLFSKFDLHRDAAEVETTSKDVCCVIEGFMKTQVMDKMCFLGTTLDSDGNLVVYYDQM